MQPASLSRQLLIGALLCVALAATMSAPQWLGCLLQGAAAESQGCQRMPGRQFWLALISVGAMLAVVGLAHPRLSEAPKARRRGLALLMLGTALVGLLGQGLVLKLTHTGPIGLPNLYTFQVLLMQAGCLLAAYEFMQRARVDRDSAARLRMAQQQLDEQIDAARLQLLQAQVEPHFLFNTLAHLRRLAQTDPSEARAMLADLLQYLGEALPELREAKSTLASELRLVRAFLALHQRRIGDTRLRLRFDIEPGLDAARLPNTGLLTLVENAIKHGIAPVITGGEVLVRARREGERLLLEVADTGRGMGSSSGHGTGLATLRARLKGLYGDAAEMNLRVNQPRGLVATLQLPLEWTP
jgi:two-component sensor histidine kinase